MIELLQYPVRHCKRITVRRINRKSGERGAAQESNGNRPLYNMRRRVICTGLSYAVFFQENDRSGHGLKKLADEQSFVPFYRFVFLLVGPGGKQLDRLLRLIGLLHFVIPATAAISARQTGQPRAQNRVVCKAQGGQNNHQEG